MAGIRKKEEENSVDIDGLKGAIDWQFNCIKNIQFEQLRQEHTGHLIKFDRAVMIYKIINGLCPDNLKGKLVFT